MNLYTLITLGFVGFTSGGFGGAGPIPSGAARGAPSYGDFNAAVAQSLPDKPNVPAAPAGIKIPIFKASEFPFVTIVADDGTDKGGGWQEAKANLEFIKVVFPRSVTRWKCRITIKMPLRTEKMGKISPSLAATMSEGITNMVMLGMDFELPQGIFCDVFRTGVKATFKATYPFLGSSVTL